MTFPAKTNSSDSLRIVKLENEIEMLNYKVNTLENSTDRLLNGLYVTIGLILASVIGLNIWNWIVQNKRQSQKLENQLDKAQNELKKNINDKLLEFPETIRKSVESKTKSIITDIMDLRLDMIDHKSKYIDYSLNETELDLITKYIQISIDYHNSTGLGDFKVQKALVSLQEYIKKDEFVYHTEMDRLIKELSLEKFKDFRNYTDKIINELKEK
jgi:hypothetical protein